MTDEDKLTLIELAGYNIKKFPRKPWITILVTPSNFELCYDSLDAAFKAFICLQSGGPIMDEAWRSASLLVEIRIKSEIATKQK